LTATEAIGRFYEPVFFFVGAISGQRSIRAVQFEMPLEIDSFEQGVAWISYGLGDRFRPEREAHWLDDGGRWEEHLPWMHTRTSEFAGAPQARCFVKRDWFRLARKELRPLAPGASQDDLLWLAFDGETLRFTSGETVIIVPATGTAWDNRYAIKTAQLDSFPKRLSNPVEVSVWDTMLTISGRAWKLAQTAG
jgi:hypothetical protein